MKNDPISFRNFQLDHIDPNIGYSLEFVSEMTDSGPKIKDLLLQPVQLDAMPNEGSLWLLPAYIRNEMGETKLGLASYDVETGKMSMPKILDEQGHLELVWDTEFGENSNCSELFCTVGYRDEVPFFIPWDEFNPSIIEEDVVYLFHVIDKKQIDIDPVEYKFQKISEGEMDEDDELEYIQGYKPTFGLERIRRDSFPEEGLLWYIGVEIHFNSKQHTFGYGLYEVSKRKFIDVHVFDQEGEQISVLFNKEGLEDLGFFKDDEYFHYKVLLSKIANFENK